MQNPPTLNVRGAKQAQGSAKTFALGTVHNMAAQTVSAEFGFEMALSPKGGES